MRTERSNSARLKALTELVGLENVSKRECSIPQRAEDSESITVRDICERVKSPRKILDRLFLFYNVM